MGDQRLIEQLKRDVTSLTAPGHRCVGTPQHETARRFLVERMKELGLSGYHGASLEHPYKASGAALCNLLGVVSGAQPARDPILLAAHYDTCGKQPGADDNAAAVAILLACVEPLRSRRLERSVIFAFFDGEEPPHFMAPGMGSTVFYATQRKETTHAAVVLDLVGHDVEVPGIADLLILGGIESHPGISQVFAANPKPRGLKVLPTHQKYIGDLSDYAAFRADGRPYVFLTCGHWTHYHKSTDTPDRLSYGKMAAIRDFIVDTAEGLAQQVFDPSPGGDHSLITEGHCLRECLGPLLGDVGPLTTRSAMDRVAVAIKARFHL